MSVSDKVPVSMTGRPGARGAIPYKQEAEIFLWGKITVPGLVS